MPFKVTIHSNQSSFDVNSDETVLDAALNQGINLPYGCRSGFCGECKGKIINGQVTYQEKPAGLSEEDEEPKVMHSYAVVTPKVI